MSPVLLPEHHGAVEILLDERARQPPWLESPGAAQLVEQEKMQRIQAGHLERRDQVFAHFGIIRPACAALCSLAHPGVAHHLASALCILLFAMLAAGRAAAEAPPPAPACPHCAWIESKREVMPTVADPDALRVYEYTARMSNGSTRVFVETLPAGWRLRERLILIDGEQP